MLSIILVLMATTKKQIILGQELLTSSSYSVSSCTSHIFPYATAINISDKKTDELLQLISICQLVQIKKDVRSFNFPDSIYSVRIIGDAGKKAEILYLVVGDEKDKCFIAYTMITEETSALSNDIYQIIADEKFYSSINILLKSILDEKEAMY